MSGRPEARELSPNDPRSIGPYRLLGVLHGTALSRIYLVSREDQTFALKTMLHLKVADGETRERFRREVMISQHVRHANVVELKDWGYWQEGTVYLVFEPLVGRTLEAIEPPPLFDTVRPLVEQALAGVGALHAAGIVHRNLVPSNLFVTTDNIVKVLNFSLATILDSTLVRREKLRNVTGTGTTLGDLRYISPEQLCDAKHVDARSDLFSLGIIFFELLTGARPFGGDSGPQLSSRLLGGDRTHLPDLRPDLPQSLEDWLARLLAPSLGDRFQTTQAALDALL